MSTSVTLIPETVATAPDTRRDIARGFKLARRWQQQGKAAKAGARSRPMASNHA
jgi:hypothetical protein